MCYFIRMTRSEAGKLGALISCPRIRQEALRLYYLKPQICKYCEKVIRVPDGGKISEVRGKVFCSSSCSASFNNRRRILETKPCRHCGQPRGKGAKYFCSIDCDSKNRVKGIIERWLQGDHTGSKSGGVISAPVRRWCIDRAKGKCQKCGWNKLNRSTGQSPLEVHHKNGNWKDNSPSNLQVLCPNCHSLTPTFRSLNKGNGRPSRRG